MSLFPCPDFVRKLVEYQKGIFSQVSHGHDGLLTLDDNGNFVTDKLFVKSYVDDPADNVLGFETDTNAGDTYTPASPFSKDNSGSVNFLARDHCLLMDTLTGTYAKLVWSSSEGKITINLFAAFTVRAGTSYGGEVRLWGVQSPGASDTYWALRFVNDNVSYPDWPWRVKLISGTGVTFSLTDGTEVKNLPFNPVSLLNYQVRLYSSGSRITFRIFDNTSNVFSPAFIDYVDAAIPGSLKKLCVHIPENYQRCIIDAVRLS